jgi:hypothetical protein
LGIVSLRVFVLVGCGEAVGRLLSKPLRHPKSKHLIHHIHPSTAQPTTALPIQTYIFSSFLCVFASFREPGFASGVVKRSTPSTAQPTMVHVHRSLVDGNIPGSDLLLRDFKIKLLVPTVRCKILVSEGEIRLHAV